MYPVEEDSTTSERPGHAVDQAASATARAPRLYLALLLGGAALLLLLPFFIARTDFFTQASRRMFWHAMEFHDNMAGQNCGIVIFGDSTGLTGVDPATVQSRTGLKTCVLSLPYMALSTTGYRVLDDYLLHNQAPALIVFVEHARHLRRPALDEDPGVIDGWLLADKLLPPAKAAWFFASHPKFSMIFVESFWQQIFTLSPKQSVDLSRHAYRRDMQILHDHNGFYPMDPLETAQRICAEPMDGSYYDPSFLATLTHYQTATTGVLLYASPVRDCDTNLASYRHLANMLHIAPPTPYPASDFSDAWHLDEQGAARNSEEISQVIQQRLRQPTTTL